MTSFSVSHLSDHVLLHEITEFRAQELIATAAGLARLGEIDARQLYRPFAHPSMFSYCIKVLSMSEDAAYKRIRVARTARQFPAIFPALADGRLSLSAVVLLTPHLTPSAAEELFTAAAHKTNAQIELLLAQRFPRPGLATDIRSLSAPPLQPMATASLDACAGQLALPQSSVNPAQLAVRPVGMTMSEHPSSSAPHPRVTPLAPERFAVQLTIGQETHDKLRYAQALLGHAVPSGDLAQVLDRALDALIAKLEQRKFAATARSRPAARRRKANERHIPAAVRREVWRRDGGRCTFTSDKGHRCESRSRLEFDHIQAVARGGGHATASGLRLRCRAHNQYEAERLFGAGFMQHKREEAPRTSDPSRIASRDRVAPKPPAHGLVRERGAAEEYASPAEPEHRYLKRSGERSHQFKPSGQRTSR